MDTQKRLPLVTQNKSVNVLFHFSFLITFGDFRVSVVASQGADELHVAEERLGEANLMRCAATCDLDKEEKGSFNRQYSNLHIHS